MRTRSFFYVCAGLFLLALGYHLGARTAVAQGVLSWGEVSGEACGIDGAGIFYAMLRDGGGQARVWSQQPPVVGDIVAADAAGDVAFVLKSNGDAYTALVNGPWVLTGNLFAAGPTPTQRESMGSVRARYR